jgi:hypothetical protein
MYFGSELQRTLPSLLSITGFEHRGIYNYSIPNAMPCIMLILGIVRNNTLFFAAALLGKIGYYPFFFLLVEVIYSPSYVYSVLDLLSKLAYFASIIVISQANTYCFNSSPYRLLVVKPDV